MRLYVWVIGRVETMLVCVLVSEWVKTILYSVSCCWHDDWWWRWCCRWWCWWWYGATSGPLQSPLLVSFDVTQHTLWCEHCDCVQLALLLLLLLLLLSIPKLWPGWEAFVASRQIHSHTGNQTKQKTANYQLGLKEDNCRSFDWQLACTIVPANTESERQ